MILKIQRPLNSTPYNLPWLAYDEKRTFHMTFHPSPQVIKLFKDGEEKVYIEAEIIAGARAFETIKRVKDQDW